MNPVTILIHMYLAGQCKKQVHGRQAPEAGYAMAALIVGITIMAIMMTVVMPVWKQMVQREKEAELVFRGEAIAHSIGMFQRKFANAYPPSLDVLVEQKFLRKKYQDPLTGEDFVPLTQASAQAGAPGAARGAQPAPGQRGGAPATGRGTNPFAGTPTPGAAVGGIIGVTSKSTDTSIRLYKGRSHYNEWAFVYTPPAGAGTATPGAGPGGNRGNNPNNPNRGNSPFPGGNSPFPGGNSPFPGANPPFPAPNGGRPGAPTPSPLPRGLGR